MLNQKAVAQIVIVLGVLLLTSVIGGYYYFNVPKNQSENDLITHINPSLTPTPSPSIDTNNWKTYTDKTFGFEIKFPESNIDYYKRNLPAKQLISEKPADGYAITFTDDTVGKGYYFLIKISKKSGNSLLNYWKREEEQTGLRSDICDPASQPIKCMAEYSSSGKTFRYQIINDTINGKPALHVINVLDNYGANEKPLFMEWIYIDYNQNYVMEINKGSSNVANTILSTLKFTDSSSPSPSGQKVCQSDSDCSSDEYCTQAGPIIQGQQNQKSCYKKGTAVPL